MLHAFWLLDEQVAQPKFAQTLCERWGKNEKIPKTSFTAPLPDQIGEAVKSA